MGLLDVIKNKFKKEEVALDSELEPPAKKNNFGPKPYGTEELPLSPPEGMPEPLAMEQAQAVQPAPSGEVKLLLDTINTKIDLLKAQLESINQQLIVINAKLK